MTDPTKIDATTTSATGREPLAKIVVLMPDGDAMRDRLRAAFPAIDVAAADPKDAAALADADMAIGWSISPEALSGARRLRWFHLGAAGVERMMRLPGFRERNLILTNSSGISAPNMAEHAMALMLAFARGLPSLQRAQERRRWRDWDPGSASFELGGQTVLIAGLGAIGQELARRASAFDMHVIGLRRSGTGEPIDDVDEVIGLDRLGAALARTDHIVDLLPSTKGTAALFDAGRFAAMKAGAYFYNLGRGTTVDQDALIDALKSGHLAGAGLDVTDPEPLNEESPLWGMGNVIITAHTSGGSPNVRERLIALCIEQVRRYQAGEDLLNVVDQTQGY